MAVEGAPVIVADGKFKTKCKLCELAICKGQTLTKDFDLLSWVHLRCLALKVDEVNGSVGREEYERRLEDFRQAVCDASRCRRCAASRGVMCRELGKTREAVHVERLRDAERIGTVVVSSTDGRRFTA